MPRFRFKERKIFVKCPYMNCNYLTKNGVKLVKHVKECLRKYSEEGSFRWEELHFSLLSKAKRCLYKDCYFKSTDTMELRNHMWVCPSTVYNMELLTELLKVHLTIGKTSF